MPARVTVVSTTQLAVAPRTCALDAAHRRLIIGPAAALCAGRPKFLLPCSRWLGASWWWGGWVMAAVD